MHLFDLGAMAIHNLRQRPLRTALNLTGVVVGCIVLLMTAAGANGVQDAFQALFDSSEFARQIEVYRNFETRAEPPDDAIVVVGDMTEDRRERIRKRMIAKWKDRQYGRGSLGRITRETLREFAEVEHVVSVVPHIYLDCDVRLEGPRQAGAGQSQRMEALTTSADTSDVDRSTDEDLFADVFGKSGLAAAGPPSDSMRRSLVAGSALGNNDRDGVLVHEFLAYQLGFRSDKELPDLVGRQVTVEWEIHGKAASIYRLFSEYTGTLSPDTLEQQMQFAAAFRQLFADLDQTSLSEEQQQLLRDAVLAGSDTRRGTEDINVVKTFTVRGIFRGGTSSSMSNLFHQHLMGERVDLQIDSDVAIDMQFNDPERNEFHNSVLIVDSCRNLRSVCDRIDDMGFHSVSALYVIDSINRNIQQNSWIIFGVAAAVLCTAAIGISNTLMISVMERTPEFGIMKSLGAKDSDLIVLMIVEGAVLGLLGAIVALLSSWLLSSVVRILLEIYIEHQIDGDIGDNLFRFALTPILIMLLVSITVCVTASIIPALRAARLDPVVAMRRT